MSKTLLRSVSFIICILLVFSSVSCGTQTAQTAQTTQTTRTAQTTQTTQTAQTTQTTQTTQSTAVKANGVPSDFEPEPIQISTGDEIIDQIMFMGKISTDSGTEDHVIRVARIKVPMSFGGVMWHCDVLGDDGKILATFRTGGFGFAAVDGENLLLYNFNANKHGRATLSMSKERFVKSSDGTISLVTDKKAAESFNVTEYFGSAPEAFREKAPSVAGDGEWTVVFMNSMRGEKYLAAPDDGILLGDTVQKEMNIITSQRIKGFLSIYYGWPF